MATEQIQKQRAIETHSQQAEEFADSYRAFEQDAYQNCFLYSRRRLEAALAPHLPERGAGKRLLDVGCGTGHHLAALRRRGYEVAGVDGSEGMLEHARANNPGVDIRQSDVESLPFADGSFDYVICIEVLRYLPDFRRCASEMARVLRPGGVCLATAAPLFNANGYFLINRMASLVKVGGLVPLKQFFATSWRLRRGFLEAGFDEVGVKGVYTGPVNWVERLAPGMLPAFLRAWERIDARLADRAGVREFANMFLMVARKR